MDERASEDMRAGGQSDAARIAAANLKGIIAMSAAMASFACGDTLMKLASATLPTSELLFIRGLCVTTASIAAALAMGAFTELRAAMSRAMALRAGGDVAGGWLFQSGLARMAYPDLMAITQLNPLTMTAASALFLGEKVGWRRWTATFVGLIGVLIIIRPGSSAFNWWALAGIASVLAATVRDLATRRVDRRVPPILIMTLSAAAVTLAEPVAWRRSLLGQRPPALTAGKAWRPRPCSRSSASCASSSPCARARFLPSRRSATPSSCSPSSRAFWSSIISPMAPTLVGIVIVAAAGLYTFFREQKLRRLAMAKRAADGSAMALGDVGKAVATAQAHGRSTQQSRSASRP